MIVISTSTDDRLLLSGGDNKNKHSASLILKRNNCQEVTTKINIRLHWFWKETIVRWQQNEAGCLFLLSPPDNCFFSESMKPNVYFCCHLTIVSFQNQWSRMFIHSASLILKRNNCQEVTTKINIRLHWFWKETIVRWQQKINIRLHWFW
jgi:hypothetical protein